MSLKCFSGKRGTGFMLGVLLSAIFICYSCKETETVAERAAKASKEACDCYKKNPLKTCEDELNRNYTVSEDFIKEFNAVNNCGIYLYKKTTKSVTFEVINEE